MQNFETFLECQLVSVNSFEFDYTWLFSMLRAFIGEILIATLCLILCGERLLLSYEILIVPALWLW